MSTMPSYSCLLRNHVESTFARSMACRTLTWKIDVHQPHKGHKAKLLYPAFHRALVSPSQVESLTCLVSITDFRAHHLITPSPALTTMSSFGT